MSSLCFILPKDLGQLRECIELRRTYTMNEDPTIISPQIRVLIQSLYHHRFWELDRGYRHIAMGPTLPSGNSYLIGFRHPYRFEIEWIETHDLEKVAVKVREAIGPELPELDEQLILDTSLVLRHPEFHKIQQFPTDPPTFTVLMNGPNWRDWSFISGSQPLAQVMRETAEEIRHPYVEVVDPERPFHRRFWRRTPWPRVWELMKEAGIEWDMFRASWVVTKGERFVLGRGEEIAAMTVDAIHELVARKREEWRARHEPKRS